MSKGGTKMEGMKMVVFLAVTVFLLGITADYSRAADTKQKGKAVKSVEPKKPSQQPKEVAPPFPNGISIGGISIGITELTREKNIALVRFVFKRINEDKFPDRFSILVTDDRGNEYKGEVFHYPFLAMPLVGSTWITDSPVIIKIPKIAPISKFELIPETGGRFNLDYRKLTPLPPLSLKFKINPEQVFTGKEIKQDENISIWFGEVKIEETEQIEDKWEKRVEKTISVKVPVTIENRDYNPRAMEMSLSFELQLNSGRILHEHIKRDSYGIGSKESLRIHSRTVDGASKQTYEESFKVEVEKDEHVQLISVYRVPVIPFPGVFAVKGDLSPKLLGYIYISERTVTPSEIAFPELPPRRPLPPNIEDGDWFPDGSKIVVSEGTETITGKDYLWGGDIKEIKRRFFIMNPDGTDKEMVHFRDIEGYDRLNEGSVDYVAPLVSPDGKKIAFIADLGSAYATLYVMDVNGSNIRVITGWFSSLAYTWVSGDRIVFWEEKDMDVYYSSIPDSDIFYYTKGKIYVADIRSGVIERLKTPLPPGLLLRGKFVSGSVIKDFSEITNGSEQNKEVKKCPRE